MTMDRSGLVDALPGITAVSVLGLGLLALGLGYSWFWVVFVVGFAALVPLVAIVSEAVWPAEDEDERSSDAVRDGHPEQEALAVLRERYARGEIDEAEFERRVERLLNTETVDEASAWARERSVEPRAPDAGDMETETEVDQ